jgi:hypothetical protein
MPVILAVQEAEIRKIPGSRFQTSPGKNVVKSYLNEKETPHLNGKQLVWWHTPVTPAIWEG